MHRLDLDSFPFNGVGKGVSVCDCAEASSRTGGLPVYRRTKKMVMWHGGLDKIGFCSVGTKRGGKSGALGGD